jgi:Fe2+ or Zn2+ uptake regulation protein
MDSHPTADEIYTIVRRKIPRISLGTVYRNLNVLVEQGFVQRLPLEGDVDRFEATISPHYHCICEKCGKVEDFHMPHPVDINKQAEVFCKFSITRHRIDFYGICSDCREK